MPLINQIVNANIYVNGNSQVGRAKEVKLPDISSVMNEYKGLGMIGSIEIFAGFEKLEGEITWNSFYPDTFKACYNPLKNLQLMIRANLQTFEQEGITEEVPFVTQLNVAFKKNPAGVYKPTEAAEFQSSIAIYSIIQKQGGRELLAFDPVNNIYRVDGKDLLEKFRSNIGG